MLLQLLRLSLPVGFVLLLTLPSRGQAPDVPEGRFGGYPPSRSVMQKLGMVAHFEGFRDSKINLEQALDRLADRWDLTFDVNEMAFKKEGIKDVWGVRLATTTQFRIRRAPIRVILHRVLLRAPLPPETTWIVHHDGTIEITTTKFLRGELPGFRARVRNTAEKTSVFYFPWEDWCDLLGEAAGIHAALTERPLVPSAGGDDIFKGKKKHFLPRP